MSRSRPPRRSLVASLLVLAVAVALVIGVLNREDAQEPAAQETTPMPGAPAEVQGPEETDFSAAERRDSEDLLAVGPADAPVVLVVFSDYQCPFCARWSHETLPVLMEHVQDGDLRVEWRDVNVFGPDSEAAARASYAAAEQGAFWEYHDALFADGEARTGRQLREESLIDLATDLGLDVERFTADLDSEHTREQIEANARLGLDLGAHSTPAFVLGGQPIIGAQPTEVFTAAFDQALIAAQ